MGNYPKDKKNKEERVIKLTLDFKKQVYQDCLDLVEKKNQLLHHEIKAAQEAGNDQTKSSAGDKHETGRAMAQLTQENLGKQIDQIQLLQHGLNGINPENKMDKVEIGALIQTNEMLLFVGVSLGNLNVLNQSVFAISLASPLGNAMRNKKAKDVISFRNKNVEILDII